MLTSLLLAAAVLGADPMPVETFVTDLAAIKADPTATIAQRKAAEPQLVTAAIAKHQGKPFTMTVTVTGVKGPYLRDKLGRTPFEIFHEPPTWGTTEGVSVTPKKFIRVPLSVQEYNSLKVGSRVTISGKLVLGDAESGNMLTPGLYPVAIGSVRMPDSQKSVTLSMLATSISIDN